MLQMFMSVWLHVYPKTKHRKGTMWTIFAIFNYKRPWVLAQDNTIVLRCFLYVATTALISKQYTLSSKLIYLTY